MIVKNEEKNLGLSLKPLAACFDEVVVVDTGSTDKTAALAKEYGAKVYQDWWRDDFARARNRSLELASCDWIMWFDADNRMSPADVNKIKGLLIDQPLDKVFWCTEVVEPGAGRLIQKRIFPNRSDFKFKGSVHEQLIHPEQDIRYHMTDIKIYHWGYADKKQLKLKGIRNINILKNELQKKPDDFYFNFNIARCWRDFGKYENAVLHLNKVVRNEETLKQNPEIYLSAHIMLVLLYEKTGNLNKARQILDVLLAKHPDFGPGWYYSGKYYFNQGDFKEAAINFEKFLCLKISLYSVFFQRRKIIFEGLYWLARCYEKTNRLRPALKTYQKCFDFEPDNSHVYLRAGLLAARLGQKNMEKIYLQKCLSLHPANRTARAASQ